MTRAIGIDFGTSFSSVAFVNAKGQAEPVADERYPDHSALLPSIVSFADDGSVLIGRAASERVTSFPRRTVNFVKRVLGAGPEEIRKHSAGFSSPPDLTNGETASF